MLQIDCSSKEICKISTNEQFMQMWDMTWTINLQDSRHDDAPNTHVSQRYEQI